MKWLRLLLILLLLPIVLPASVVLAGSTADVTITATGIVVAAPGNFLLTYVTDYEIGITWTKPVGAVNTLIRAAYGHVPANISDGYQVYYGVGTSATDNAISLGTPEVVYYRAWSQTAGGAYGPLWASGDTSKFMSASFLFIGLIALAGMLTYFAWRRRHILICFAGSLTWLALGLWLLFGSNTNLDLGDIWTQLLAYVFIMMAAACGLFLMDVEIGREYKGKRWVEYGGKPKIESPSSYEEYAAELRRRIRGSRR